jgi:hypothetical protein
MWSFINLFFTKPRNIGWAGHVARMGETRNAYILMAKPERKRPLEGYTKKLDGYIKIDLQ